MTTSTGQPEEHSQPALTFKTILRLEGKTATGIQVPVEVVEALGKGKRPPVLVTIGNHTYRSTVAAYGDVFMLPVSAENRIAAGVQAGQEIEVTLQLDTQPRVVNLPHDFKQRLEGVPPARAFFESLSYSNQRRIVLNIEGAKTAETRQQRIDKAVQVLAQGKTP